MPSAGDKENLEIELGTDPEDAETFGWRGYRVFRIAQEYYRNCNGKGTILNPRFDGDGYSPFVLDPK